MGHNKFNQDRDDQVITITGAKLVISVELMEHTDRCNPGIIHQMINCSKTPSNQ